MGAPDGLEAYRDRISGPATDAIELGRTLASRMQAAGAGPLLERLRSEAGAPAVTQPLAGLVVVVTRPARQAARFIAMLEELGAATVAFPTVIIEPVPLDDCVRAALAAQPADWVVYTSANAVEQVLAQAGQLPRAATAVIGRATARAVEAAGTRVDAIPATGSDSEGLLALPAFAAPSGQHIVVFKGVGGRDALRAELVRRGATVSVAEVYRRRPARAGGGLAGEAAPAPVRRPRP